MSTARPRLAASHRAADSGVRWLLLIHQLPPEPAYLRVKIWRRLQRLGAVAIKNSVYALPASEQANEDFEWVRREIVQGGGDAAVCEARLVEGLTDREMRGMFNAARDAHYAELVKKVRALAAQLPSRGVPRADLAAEIVAKLEPLRAQLADVERLDFFGAPGREGARRAVAELEAAVSAPHSAGRRRGALAPRDYRGRVWVTRTGIHVDRMASAWLIRRFIDTRARLEFVDGKGYEPAAGELRFDMFGGEFTHEGDLCSFEVLVARFGLADPALHAIAEIVHDVDLKDGKHGRPETAGVDHLVAGIAMGTRSDEERLARGSAVFDGLYEYFSRKGR